MYFDADTLTEVKHWMLDFYFYTGSTGCTKVNKDLSSLSGSDSDISVSAEKPSQNTYLRGPSECFGTLLQWLTSRATIYFDLKYQHVPTETMSFNRTEFGLVFCKESCSWYYTYHVKLLENVSAKQRLSLVIRERLFNVFVLSFRCFFKLKSVFTHRFFSISNSLQRFRWGAGPATLTNENADGSADISNGPITVSSRKLILFVCSLSVNKVIFKYLNTVLVHFNSFNFSSLV